MRGQGRAKGERASEGLRCGLTVLEAGGVAKGAVAAGLGDGARVDSQGGGQGKQGEAGGLHGCCGGLEGLGEMRRPVARDVHPGRGM